MKLRISLLITSFLIIFISQHQKCFGQTREEIERRMFAKTQGWEFVKDTTVNFDPSDCPKSVYIFFYKGNGFLQIDKKTIKCDKAVSMKTIITTNYQLVKDQNNHWKLRIYEFNPYISNVVHRAVNPNDVMRFVDFDVLFDTKHMILATEVSKRSRAENFFK